MTPAADLAARYNLQALRGRREWRGTCPLCDYQNAFSLTEKGGYPTFWCFACQDRKGLAGLASDAASKPTMMRLHHPPAVSWADKAIRILELWSQGTPCPETRADIYLAARGLPGVAGSPALRFHSAIRHPYAPGRLPAMLASVVDVNGHPIGLHRTYLRSDGRGKAGVEPAKASLGRVRGGAIRLHEADSEIVIGEGIESAAAAGVLLGLPAWAAIATGNLARSLILPRGVRSVVIAADHDPPGITAANAAAARWKADGRIVRVVVPDREGWDFNNQLERGETPHD